MPGDAARRSSATLGGGLRRWRWLFLLSAGLALYAGLGFLVVPWLLARELPALVREATGREARVERIEFNPFSLTLRAQGFSLGEADAPLVALGEFFVDVEARSLIDRALVLAQLRFTGLRLDVVRDPNGAINLLDLVPAAPPEEAPPASTELPRLVVRELRVEDGSIDFADQTLPETFRTRIGPVDLGLADLSTLPEATGRHELAMTLESGSRLAVSGELALNPLHAAGMLTLEGPALGLVHRYVRDQLRFEVPVGRTAGTVRFDVRSSPAGELDVTFSDFDLGLADVRLSAPSSPDFLSWRELRVSGGALRWPAREVTIGEIVLRGAVVSANLDADGHLDLAELLAPVASDVAERAAPVGATAPVETGEPMEPAEPEWAVRVGKVTIEDLKAVVADAAPAAGARWEFADVDLSLREVTLAEGATLPFTAGLALAAGGRVDLDGTLGLLPDPMMDAALRVSDLPLSLLQPYVSDVARVEIRGGVLGMDGRIATTPRETLSFAGDVNVRDFASQDLVRREKLLAWRLLALDDLELSLDANRLRATRVRLEQPFGRIFIDRDQSTNLGDLLVDTSGSTAAGASEAPAVEPAQTPSQPPLLRARIGEVVVRQGDLDFTDLSLPLPFAARIEALDGKLTTIDTRSSAPSRVGFEGRVAPYGLARIGGEVSISSPTDLADLRVVFRNIEMAPLSPYTIKFAGRKIAGGRMDLDLGYQLQDRRLVGTNKIVISDIELGEKVPHPDAVDLPLGLAIALLRDANGCIDLDLPVSGSLDDPEFRVGPVLWKAFVNLVTRVATAPFRALAGMLGLQSEAFDVIEFPPGRADLLPPGQEKLAQLASALVQRPQLALEVPAVLDPEVDTRVLREVRIDALIEGELASSGAPEAGRERDKRRRRISESLYKQAFPERPLDELRTAYMAPPADDPEGKARLDELAWLERLRSDLAAAQPVPTEDLDALALARAQSIRAALLAAGTVDGARVRAGSRTEVGARDGEWIGASLGLVPAEATSGPQ